MPNTDEHILTIRAKHSSTIHAKGDRSSVATLCGHNLQSEIEIKVRDQGAVNCQHCIRNLLNEQPPE